MRVVTSELPLCVLEGLAHLLKGVHGLTHCGNALSHTCGQLHIKEPLFPHTDYCIGLSFPEADSQMKGHMEMIFWDEFPENPMVAEWDKEG